MPTSPTPTPASRNYYEVIKDRDAYRERVSKYCALAEQDPQTYVRRVKSFAAVGYAAIGALVLLAICYIALVAAILWLVPGAAVTMIKFAWVPVIPIFLGLRAFFVKPKPPIGKTLTRAETPQLFTMVDEVRAKLNAPEIHEILLDQGFNAFAVQVPWIGPFGPFKNYLYLGLPLLLAGGEEEVKSVIAHELGHFTGGHGAVTAKVYRQTAVWRELYKSQGRYLKWFFDWYFPKLNAMAFALLRRHEFEADAAEIEVVGVDASALLLIRLAVLARYFYEDIAKGIYERAAEQPEPPENVYEEVREGLQTGVPQELAEKFLKEALTAESRFDDEHPSLTARLAAIGALSGEASEEKVAAWAVSARKAAQPSAAELLLGSELVRIKADMSEQWKIRAKKDWQQRYKAQSQMRARLEELDSKPDDEKDPVMIEVERAYLIAETKSVEESIPLFEEVLSMDPNNAQANYALGYYLAGKSDTGAEEYLLKAVKADARLKGKAANLLVGLFHELKNSEKAAMYYDWAREVDQEKVERQKALKVFSRSDRYEPLELDEETARVIAEMAKAEKVKEVYAVRKLYPGGSVKMLFLIRTPFVVLNAAAVKKKNQDTLNRFLAIGGFEYARMPASNESSLIHKLRKIKGARVYPVRKKR